MGTTSASSEPRLANRWKARLPSPIRRISGREQIRIGGVALAWPSPEEPKAGQRNENIAEIARRIGGLGEKGRVAAALAVKKHMLAEYHGPLLFVSIDTLIQWHPAPGAIAEPDDGLQKLTGWQEVVLRCLISADTLWQNRTTNLSSAGMMRANRGQLGGSKALPIVFGGS